MNKKMSLVILGIGGYGKNYVTWSELDTLKDKVEIVGLIDPYYENAEIYKNQNEFEGKFFKDLEDFYLAGLKTDIVIIATPIHTHKNLVELAMKNGSDVICEKPVAGSLQDGLEMKAISEKYNKILPIAFQWSYSDSILNLKKDILTGKFGKPLRYKSLLNWPRDLDYYNLRPWAGKIKSKDGFEIMDNIASNATSHYLHNMMFLLGEELNTTGKVKTLEGKIYRANNIETYDACELKIETDKNVEVLFYTGHCVKNPVRTAFELEFEKGKVVFEGQTLGDKELKAIMNDGEKISYGTIDQSYYAFEKIILAHFENKPELIICDINTALTHLTIMEDINKNLDKVNIFSDEEKDIEDFEDKKFVYGKNMKEILENNYNKNEISQGGFFIKK